MLFLLPLLATPPALADSSGAPWSYVVPSAEDPFEPAPLRALALTPVKPADLVEKVTYRGKRRRYAQIRYGTPTSVRVTAVLDESGPGAAVLYVDANRDRRIEAIDKVAPDGTRRTWRLALALAGGEAAGSEPRSCIFRLGATGITLSFAALGYLEGRVVVGTKEHAARRVDGDSNGLWTDPKDQLWIDLNDDGKWDRAAEVFLYAPTLVLAGTRYGLRSDALGCRLTLNVLAGTGSVRLGLTGHPIAGKVAEISATLVGRDGAAVGISGAGDTTVAVGEYRLAMVSLLLDDPAGGPPWLFIFSDNGRRGEAVWHAVSSGADLVIDPIGTLEFGTGLDASEAARPGLPLDFQPTLYTSDGLLIVSAARGTPAASREGPTGAIALCSADGRRLDTAHSGFA
jgi:hypothetical protein